MTPRTPHRTRSLPRWLSIAAGLVVVLGVLAGALHHHAPEESSSSHPCLVCTLHHSPAVPVAVSAPAPPAQGFELVLSAAFAAPCTAAIASAPARAPPIA